ncbi:MAG: protocatechuate 3,4-dioxygenase subunit beta [Terriglobia bacterium]|nr:MAG: protocatechuate 3,4-dioxygenase subunit beta [Terriglobia bacterium]
MAAGSLPQTAYLPYDDRTQTLRQIKGYPRSWTRTPAQPLIERPLTLSELTGPTGLEEKLNLGNGDFSCLTPGGPRAIGQLISVSGRVTDEDGAPLTCALVEVWQANSAGKYIHQLDRHQAPLDANFTGQGRFRTGADGSYQFRTIKPGGYPVMESDWWWRPPHIHFSIFGPSWMNRYVTQIFFPGEPLNETDLLLNGVLDPEARQRLIFQPQPTKVESGTNMLSFRLDFVLRGKNSTPALG